MSKLALPLPSDPNADPYADAIFNCKTCGDGEFLPIYGVGPHRHEGDSFIGSTVHLPQEEWPANYKEDPDAPGCGTWTCPDCDGCGKNPRDAAAMPDPNAGRN